jgi:hypothetical protein
VPFCKVLIQTSGGLVLRQGMTMVNVRHTLLALALLLPTTAHAETREEWIALGARVHGAFGPFIAVGAKPPCHAWPMAL